VEAAIHGDVSLLKQAMMMDPLTGAVCNPPEIWQMADEMLVALAPWMPQWREEAARAADRLATGTRVATQDYRGAARLEVKSVEEMEEKAAEQRALASESDKGKSR
jgi:alpha-galactosidase